MLDKLINDLVQSRHLSNEQIYTAVDQLVDDSVSEDRKVEFLCRLALKGETVEEIAAFASALRERAIVPPIDAGTRAKGILDVCGTGGDRLNTFNISTTVAFVCAAAGVPVAKHGNRAVSSQAGSADVLKALGVRIQLPPDEAARSLRERNFAFFFAPLYHPAFQVIAPVRRLCADRGQRTIFNFLGPLLNPARPAAQLVGVPRPEMCEPLARVLQLLGVRRGMVVSGEVPAERAASPDGVAVLRHMDELSTLGLNTVTQFDAGGGYITSTFRPTEFPLQFASLADLAGGDGNTNAAIVRRILGGGDSGPRRDAVLLNAAMALFVAGRSATISEGWSLAAGLIDSGQALNKLNELSGQ